MRLSWANWTVCDRVVCENIIQTDMSSELVTWSVGRWAHHPSALIAVHSLLSCNRKWSEHHRQLIGNWFPFYYYLLRIPIPNRLLFYALCALSCSGQWTRLLCILYDLLVRTFYLFSDWFWISSSSSSSLCLFAYVWLGSCALIVCVQKIDSRCDLIFFSLPIAHSAWRHGVRALILFFG